MWSQLASDSSLNPLGALQRDWQPRAHPSQGRRCVIGRGWDEAGSFTSWADEGRQKLSAKGKHLEKGAGRASSSWGTGHQGRKQGAPAVPMGSGTHSHTDTHTQTHSRARAGQTVWSEKLPPDLPLASNSSWEDPRPSEARKQCTTAVFAPLCSPWHDSQQPRGRSNPGVHQQVNG